MTEGLCSGGHQDQQGGDGGWRDEAADPKGGGGRVHEGKDQGKVLTGALDKSCDVISGKTLTGEGEEDSSGLPH